jgi:catechol 2,3-dioxygenase-like lactoylglutathione lyase family enzyme
MISTTIDTGDPMTALPRVQLALNVADVDAAVDFYSRLFGAEPHKQRPGYANFALDAPPLKLVLIENAAAAGSINHLGVEVADTAGVGEAQQRIAEAGLTGRDEADVVCCHARQDKVWVNDPDGAAWEVYTITDDNPELSLAMAADGSADTGSVCCAG